MKIYLTIVLVLLLNTVSFCQSDATLEETQDWIKEKLESSGTWYEFVKVRGENLKVALKLESINFSDKEINISIKKSHGSDGSYFIFNDNYIIRVNDIAHLNLDWVGEKGQYQDAIKFLSNTNSIKSKTVLLECNCRDEFRQYIGQETNGDNVNKVILGFDFSQEPDLRSRFKKASDHYLELIKPKQKQPF